MTADKVIRFSGRTDHINFRVDKTQPILLNLLNFISKSFGVISSHTIAHFIYSDDGTNYVSVNSI